MINSNYYLYFYTIFAVSSNSAYVMAEFDSYTHFVVTGMNFIDYHHADHPMAICKSRVGEDAIWIGYYDDVIPSDICKRHISCRANDVPDREFTTVYPETGARCQRRTQNQYYNFGYGCWERHCVPIICMDERCRQSHGKKPEKHDRPLPVHNVITPTDHPGQRYSRKTQQDQYFSFSSSPYRPQPVYSPSPQYPHSSQSTINPYAQPEDVTSQTPDVIPPGKILRFSGTELVTNR